MAACALAGERGLELVQQLALRGGQVDRGFHHHLAVQIARGAAAHRLHALVAQAEDPAGLGLGGDADLGFAAEGRHAHRVPERRLREADRHFAVQVVAVALEDVVRTHAHFDIQIARLGARGPGLAFAGKADAVTTVDAGRHLHRQHLFLFHAAIAAAGRTGTLEGLAAAMAGRARLLHREDAALEAHLAVAVAGVAGLERPVFGTAAPAGLAFDQGGQVDAALHAGDGLFQVELHHIADVGTAARTARASTAEDVAEDVAKDVAHVRTAAEAGAGVAATHAMFARGVAVLVAHAALAAVGQHLVGLLALLERRFGGVVAGVAVGVVLHRAAAIGLLQLVLGGIAADAEDFVVIALAHRSRSVVPGGPEVRGPDTRREPEFIRSPPWAWPSRPGPLPRLQGPSGLAVVVLDLGELGVDDVVRRLAGRIPARVALGVATLSGGTDRGEQRLGHLFQSLGLGLDLALVVTLHRGLDLGDGGLDATDHIARDLVAVVLDRAAGAVHQGIGLVAGADQLVELLVVLAVRLGVGDHPLDLVVGQAGAGLDLDLLLLAGLLVLGGDVDDAVGVDVERHFNLRHAARRGIDAGKVELGQRLVVAGLLALALQHVHRHRGLVVFGSRKRLRSLGRDGGVLLDDLGEHAAQGLDAEAQRGHVEQQHVLDVAGQHAALDRGADGDRLVRLHVLARLLSEELGHRRLHLGHACLAADQDHVVDVAGAQA